MLDFDYRRFESVLKYYGRLSKEEIDNSSLKYLFSIYYEFPERACENLGVSGKPKNNEDENADGKKKYDLKDSDYPVELRKGQKFTNSFDAMFADIDKKLK